MTDPDTPNWEGTVDRECGEHRTVGPHRAWCFDCSEWCYPPGNCKGCELPALRAERDALAATLHDLKESIEAEADLIAENPGGIYTSAGVAQILRALTFEDPE